MLSKEEQKAADDRRRNSKLYEFDKKDDKRVKEECKKYIHTNNAHVSVTL